MTDNKIGFFTDKDGLKSMRRLLAFMLIITSIVDCLLSVIFSYDWKITLIITAVPLVGAIVILYFTSWTDISETVKSVRGK